MRTVILKTMIAAGGLFFALTSVKAIDTSIFTADTLFIEAEDADYGHGKTVTDKKIGMDGPYDGGAFKGLGTQDDADFDWHSSGPDGQAYRPDTGLSAGKENGSAGSDRGTFQVKSWWTLGWNDAGEWYNYTRTFPSPAKDYLVFGHLSSGGNPINMELEQVTSGVGQVDDQQVKKPLGVFSPGRPTAGWDSLELFPLTDANGALVTVNLGGKVTLRITIQPGSNSDQDYFAFVPAPTTPSFLGQPSDAFVFSGATVAFSVVPGAVGTIKWQKNGVDVPNSNTSSLSVVAAAADDGAKFKAILTTKAGTVASSEATLNVATLLNEFAPGLAKWDVYRDITGNTVDSLTSDPKYPDKPDETRILDRFESPVNVYEAFGARLSGFFVPPSDGNYVFFMTSDDNGALFLSTDDKPANKKQIAAETNWSNAREWVSSGGSSDLDSKRSDKFPTTEWPGGNTIKLTGGKHYYLEVLAKEGGGGDDDGATVIKEGDPDPASGTPSTLTGSFIGANAKPNKGDPQIIKQPVFPAQLEEGRSYRFTVDAVVNPTGFNFQPIIQWQKNGANIQGANGKAFSIVNAKAADAGTYRAVVSAPSGKSVNSTESAALAVVPDTFPPVPTAGALLKGGKQEIGVGFDEAVTSASAGDKANYSLSGGTIDSVRVVNRPKSGFDASLNIPEYNGVVVVASGLTAGQSYQLTVKNVADLKGNKIPAAGVNASFKAEDKKTWSVVGSNENKYPNDVVRLDDGSFDVMSSGVAFWADYDEATFVNEKVKGDFDAKVQLIDQDPSSQWARTGLMAREGLDEGKVRPDRGTCDMALVDGVYCVPKDKLFSRLQTVHANAAIRADAGVSNDAYENHWRAEDTYNKAWGNQMNSADGGFGPLDYPNVWMRLQRDGNFLVTYRSTDGQNWNQMTRREFTKLADELYVGPFYAPELDNNPNTDNFPGGIDDLLKHSVVAKFRNYSISTGAAPPPPPGPKFTAFSFTGGKLHIEWTGNNAKLQRADAVTGPWADVTGATSPRDVDPAGAGAFYRLVGQ